MKVKELLARMGFENPESEVVPGRDDNGHLTMTVLPPEHTFGEPILGSEEAKATFGSHIDRVERIRLAIGSYYGLPVRCRIDASPHGEWVELIVKSPTGKRVAAVELSIGYVLRQNDLGWFQDRVNRNSGDFKRFRECTPDLAGYHCGVHQVIRAGKLLEAIQKLCEAPTWLQVKQEEDS